MVGAPGRWLETRPSRFGGADAGSWERLARPQIIPRGQAQLAVISADVIMPM
jgi:hypothetical protein